MAAISLNLWAKQGTLHFPDGTSVPFWGFASAADTEPQLPGPEIKVETGDILTVTLYNELDDYVSLIFPGQRFIPHPVKENGLFVSYNTHTAPGGSVTYTLTADRPGVFLYESGTRPERQVTMGLYGAIVIHPAVSEDHPRHKTAYGQDTRSEFDLEKVLVLGEIDSLFNEETAAGNPYNLLDFTPNYWLINGRVYPHTLLPDNINSLVSQPLSSKINATPREQILLRCINAGSQNHTIRFEGITARVVAIDSWPLKAGEDALDATYLKNTITIAAGESYDLIFTPPSKGQYFIHARNHLPLTNVDQFSGGMATRIDIKSRRFTPAPPRNFRCSTLSSDAVMLTWRTRENTADGFIIERKVGTDPFRQITLITDPNSNQYIDTGLLPGTSYIYRIMAFCDISISDPSNTCTAFTLPAGTFWQSLNL